MRDPYELLHDHQPHRDRDRTSSCSMSNRASASMSRVASAATSGTHVWLLTASSIELLDGRGEARQGRRRMDALLDTGPPDMPKNLNDPVRQRRVD